MAVAMTVLIAQKGTAREPQGKENTMLGERKPSLLKINLDSSFLPKVHSYTVLAEKVMALARDLDGLALSMTFPWEGNSKYKCGSSVVLKNIYPRRRQKNLAEDN